MQKKQRVLTPKHHTSYDWKIRLLGKKNEKPRKKTSQEVMEQLDLKGPD